jgi:hypothetical protein
MIKTGNLADTLLSAEDIVTKGKKKRGNAVTGEHWVFTSLFLQLLS